MFAAIFRKQLLVMAAAIAAIVYSPLPRAAEIGAQEAVDRVQQETGGKILTVQTLRIGKRKIFRIKVLTPNGQVRVVEVQADQ
ncbi:PepSY domain-containing protein [Dokdonella sp.]|uniref:PepSY domain-containing protein n=1 Tax=Dokdonella sp. TaxID=2291710 RepID=UPI003C57E8D4